MTVHPISDPAKRAKNFMRTRCTFFAIGASLTADFCRSGHPENV
jgi:hypothetical protein